MRHHARAGASALAVSVSLLALAGRVSVASAQAAPPTTSDSTVARAPSAAPAASRRLTVNGFYTQGFGISRGGQSYGIPNEGTADLRRAALLARFRLGASDRVVSQLAHRRVGEAPRASYLPEVKVDWLFWEHAFGASTHLRVGRFAVPYGIFAETRYVGTELPFYQAPAAFYRESDFTNEAIDGASLQHEFFAESTFPVEVTAYGGGLNYVESLSLLAGTSGAWRYVTAPAAARQVVGVQAWLGTPLPGLRLGAGASRGQLRGGYRQPAARDTSHVLYASVDGAFERATLRAEVMNVDMRGFGARSGYVQAGVRPVLPLWLNVQYERTDIDVHDVPVPPTFRQRGTLDVNQMRDVAVGASWTLVSGVQLRAEAHHAKGYHYEQDGVSYYAPARRGRYFVVGAATSF